jgi:hypothetical protein
LNSNALKVLPVLLIAAIAAGCGTPRRAQPKPSAGQPAKSKVKSFPVRYVVKLTPAAWQLFSKAPRGPLKPDELPVEELAAVSDLRKIAYWKPVYPETIQSDAVGLNRMYLLVSEEETNVEQTLQAFEALSDWVEYIEDGGRE